jgi:curved DNA-binding protein CbpA
VTEAARVLGVDPDADQSTVDDAYRERVKEVHPDAGGDAERFKRVKQAYETLSD